MIPISISLGDPAGVGPEVLVKALADPLLRGRVQPIVFGDHGILARAASISGVPIDFEIRAVTSLNPADCPPGQFNERGGRAQVAYLEAAAQALETGEARALVTGPIHKRALTLMQAAGPGQTEWLAARFHVALPVMMLAGPRLKVVLATTHLPLRQVAGALDRQRLVDLVLVAAADLGRYFYATPPRLALAALNPHGEEHGAEGREEREILVPAVAELRAAGVNIVGPLPADALFVRAAAGAYDAVVALYHDQGLGPLKLLHFSEAINVTLGLGRIRTSPDHGVAYDIAGRGLADPTSMHAAIARAADMAERTSPSAPKDP
jgi:4-hydroxythreonine-4-phosphate dehydrogenase